MACHVREIQRLAIDPLHSCLVKQKRTGELTNWKLAAQLSRKLFNIQFALFVFFILSSFHLLNVCAFYANWGSIISILSALMQCNG